MNTNDFFALFIFILTWFQPILWMFFFYNKTTKLDRLAKFAMPTTIMGLVSLYLLKSLLPNINYIFTQTPMLTLYILYITLGFLFASYLMNFRGWHFPQAISIAVLVVFIGSFYWESPYLVSNAFILGFQLDWVLHLMGLMLVWFIMDSIGWKTDKRTIVLVGLGFVIATAFMLGWYIPPIYSRDIIWAEIWNSPYYICDRIICTTIAFLAIKKDTPVWRRKI